MAMAIRKEPRPPELDKFAAAFSVAGERQERVSDQKTPVLLKRFLRTPGVEKAKADSSAPNELRSHSTGFR
jgi:hypothetical protein